MPTLRAVSMSLMAAVAVLLLFSEARAGEQPPYGHKDFYPSDERPIGYRGDGNGYFPGATPPTVFSEGTPVEKQVEIRDRRGDKKTESYIAIVDDKPRNMVWKTEMPSWANSQPIVVGDKVFTVGEPDWLICTDVRTGKVLWAKRVSAWHAMKLKDGLADRIDGMFQVYLALDGFLAAQFTDRQPRWSSEKFAPMVKVFQEKSLPRMLADLKKFDPESDYAAGAKKLGKDLALFVQDEKKYKNIKGAVNGRGSLARQLAERINSLSGQKMSLDMPWGNMVGWAMSVPVSDGKHVYASFGQGQTVCFDLNGDLKWAKFVQTPLGRTDSVQSPLLSGKVLIDMHGGAGVLRGLDKQTGETLWTAPTASDKLTKQKGGYYVGSHKIMTLRKDGETMDVVVTTMCNIIRASDGKVVGFLPWEWSYGPSGGPSVFNAGNIVFRAANGDGGGSPFTAYKLTMLSKDQVQAEQIYAIGKKGSPGYHGQVATPKHLIMTNDESNVVDAATGKIIRKSRRHDKLGELSNILAGNLMIWCDQGHRDPLMSHWGKRRTFDGKVAMRFYAADVSDPANPKRVDDRNVLAGENVPRFAPYETYLKELYDQRKLWGSWNGLPAHFMHVDTGILPQGNRLFIRSVSHLYCIGDPNKPWHTPKDATEAARTDAK